MLIFQYRAPAPARREESAYRPPSIAELTQFRSQVARVFMEYRDEITRTGAHPTAGEAYREICRRLERISYTMDYTTHTMRMSNGECINGTLFMGFLAQFRNIETSERMRTTMAQDTTSRNHPERIYTAAWQEMNSFLVPLEQAALIRTRIAPTHSRRRH